MRTCAHCGRENDDASRFCEDCGKPVEASSTEKGSKTTGPAKPVKVPANGPVAVGESLACPFCGNPAISGLPFCPTCGQQVIEPPSHGTACTNCGTPASSTARFCAACGEGIEPDERQRTDDFAIQRSEVRAELAVVAETGKVLDRYVLIRKETTIGREGADIEFADDRFMSPLHAQISFHDRQFFVRDLGSRNGTWLFLSEPYRLCDGDQLLVGSQVFAFRRLGYPGPHPRELDATRRMGSLVPRADIASLIQLRSDGSERDMLHLSPGRDISIGRETGDWIFPYDPSMSGVHAHLRSEDADFTVVDAGSQNGVAIGVRGETTINNGSCILVGDKLLRLETP